MKFCDCLQALQSRGSGINSVSFEFFAPLRHSEKMPIFVCDATVKFSSSPNSIFYRLKFVLKTGANVQCRVCLFQNQSSLLAFAVCVLSARLLANCLSGSTCPVDPRLRTGIPQAGAIGSRDNCTSRENFHNCARCRRRCTSASMPTFTPREG